MGTLLVTKMNRSKLYLLKEYNILGQALNCDIIINATPLPYLWIEIRYFKEYWIWNVLNGETETIGTGSFIQQKWRKLSRPIRFGEHLRIELIDTSAPEPLIEDNHRMLAPLSHYPQIEKTSANCYKLQGQGLPSRVPCNL